MTDQQKMAIERPDTEWTDSAPTPTAADYRELQAKHDQLQSKYKAAMDDLRVARDGAEWCSSEELDLIDALLAGEVLEATPDAMVSLSDIASLQRYTLGGLCCRDALHDCGAEMEPNDEGEYVLLAEALMLAATPKPEGAA